MIITTSLNSYPSDEVLNTTKCNNLCGNFEALTYLLHEKENFLTQDSEKSNNKKNYLQKNNKRKRR